MHTLAIRYQPSAFRAKLMADSSSILDLDQPAEPLAHDQDRTVGRTNPGGCTGGFDALEAVRKMIGGDGPAHPRGPQLDTHRERFAGIVDMPGDDRQFEAARVGAPELITRLTPEGALGVLRP